MAALAIILLLSSLSAKSADNYRCVAMGEIEDKVATNAGFKTKGWSYAHFGFTACKASNGNGWTVFYDDFDKPEEAQRFLDFKAGNALKVLSRSAKRDADGKPIRYRVELIPKSDRSDVEVLWVVGVAVHWITARSLDDATAFEKLYGN
jgi:hypothetical protein